MPISTTRLQFVKLNSTAWGISNSLIWHGAHPSCRSGLQTHDVSPSRNPDREEGLTLRSSLHGPQIAGAWVQRVLQASSSRLESETPTYDA